ITGGGACCAGGGGFAGVMAGFTAGFAACGSCLVPPGLPLPSLGGFVNTLIGEIPGYPGLATTIV
ncbi:MAG TPA: hypothetical protein VIF09_19785, partial [Polyangiaceae bacterium]